MSADPSLKKDEAQQAAPRITLRLETASLRLVSTEAVSRPLVLVFVPVWVRVWIAAAVSEPAVARAGAPAPAFAAIVAVLESVFAEAPVAVVGAVAGFAVVSLRQLFVFAIPVAAVVAAAAGAGVPLAVVSASRRSAADVAAGVAD